VTAAAMGGYIGNFDGGRFEFGTTAELIALMQAVFLDKDPEQDKR
jgi:hypothetical protein